MHVVVIFGWKEETPDLVRSLAEALGITAFESRQRMVGGGPAVAGRFADRQGAMAAAAKLDERGIKTLVLDAALVCGSAGHFVVRRYEIAGESLRVDSGDGRSVVIPYDEITLLISGMSMRGSAETRTVTERKLSLGKTLLSGGIPMTKKVSRQEEMTTEVREKFLYLYSADRVPAIFSQDGITYNKLGPALKPSREQNFAHLIAELRRLSPNAVYDDRLLTLAGQIRLLGPAQNPETNLDLGAAILAKCLRHS